MVFTDLVDSINQAYKDHDFLALQYLGTCLSSSVFGMVRDRSGIEKDVPETLAQLCQGINSAFRERDFKAMHHLGNRLAAASVLAHVAQTCVIGKTAVNRRCDAALAVGTRTVGL